MEGKIESGESFADSESFAKFNDRIAHTLESLDSFAVREELIYLKTKMLAEKEISGHEILQMTKEICNQYLFFMKSTAFRWKRTLWRTSASVPTTVQMRRSFSII